MLEPESFQSQDAGGLTERAEKVTGRAESKTALAHSFGLRPIPQISQMASATSSTSHQK